MSEKIALIDADSILYSAFYGKKVSDPITGEPQKIDDKYVIVSKTDEEIQESLDGILYHIFNEGGFTHYILFVKGENTTIDRLIDNPDYKQHRTKEVPEKWEFTKDYVVKRWNANVIDDIEVDDAVRICSKRILNSHIVAIDKDLLWLEGTNFNWRKNEWTEVNKAQEEEYLSKSLIIGDTVDNIKGLPGKGEAFCKKNNIKMVNEAFIFYLIEYGIGKGVDQFYKNFKSLYILEESEKYTELPIPIKIEKDDAENRGSRSTTGELHST